MLKNIKTPKIENFMIKFFAKLPAEAKLMFDWFKTVSNNCIFRKNLKVIPM
jgi:hypothetical protein